MEGKTSTVSGTKEHPEFTFTRIFNAPRELVFKAWTDPKMFAKWWGPSNFTVPVCELDPQPGGILHVNVRAQDGSIFPSSGAFHEVVPLERLILNIAWVEPAKTLINVYYTITFIEQNGKTKMVMHSRVLTLAPEAAQAFAGFVGMEEGGNQSLDKLAEVVEKA